MTCEGCRHYVRKGVVKSTGRVYPKCNREGAIELAMEERKTGACGPEASLKE